MLKRNGIGIGIDIFPPNRNPSLYVYNEKTNTVYKVATFGNENAVQLFKQAVVAFFRGIVKEDSNGAK